ncbi:MAG: aminotransferase class IV [Fastidiosipilaceae bacterium]|jgi:branched-chain amino acid aminotransferase|nr:aminotransferase class IV [Clostridiaceae bacterium]
MAYPMLDGVVGEYCLVVLDDQPARILPLTDSLVHTFLEPTDDALFYEVLQIRQGVPVFWDDHIARLQHTWRTATGEVPKTERLLDQAAEFLNYVDISQGNLKIVQSKEVTLIYLSDWYYPTKTMFDCGVSCGIMEWERENPNVKQIHSDYKQAVAEAFLRLGPEGKFFELLLQDRKGYFTEGSRSNLFFTAGNEVYSPPDELILLGITRKYVLGAIERAGFVLKEQLLTFDEVRAGQAEGAFITGSPIDVLPIRGIENFYFAEDIPASIKAIQSAYWEQVSHIVERDRRRFYN